MILIMKRFFILWLPLLWGHPLVLSRTLDRVSLLPDATNTSWWHSFQSISVLWGHGIFLGMLRFVSLCETQYRAKSNCNQMSLDLVSLNETQGVLAVPQPRLRSISNVRALVILLRLNSACHEVSKDALSSEYYSEAALDGWDSVKCVSAFLDKRHQIFESEWS